MNIWGFFICFFISLCFSVFQMYLETVATFINTETQAILHALFNHSSLWLFETVHFFSNNTKIKSLITKYKKMKKIIVKIFCIDIQKKKKIFGNGSHITQPSVENDCTAYQYYPRSNNYVAPYNQTQISK